MTEERDKRGESRMQEEMSEELLGSDGHDFALSLRTHLLSHQLSC